MDVTRAGWRKSSYSGTNGGDCVEVGALSGTIAVRDSKDPDGPVLAVCSDTWRVFTSQVKDGGYRLA